MLIWFQELNEVPRAEPQNNLKKSENFFLIKYEYFLVAQYTLNNWKKVSCH
jgi:hypothetical protein